MKRIVHSSISGVAQAILNTVLAFLCIPIFISQLGIDAYGIFSVIAVVGSLNVFLHLGINESLIKHLSEQSRCEESNYDIVVSLILVSSLWFVFIVMLYASSGFIVERVFKIPHDYIPDGIWLFRCVSVSFALMFIGGILTAVIDSTQKVYLNSYVQMMHSIVYYGGLIGSLTFGFGLRGVGLALVFTEAVWLTTLVIMARREWGRFYVPDLCGNFWRVAKKQVSYGGQIYLGGIVGFLHEPFVNILISNFLGVGFVSFWSIGLRIKNQLRSVLSKLLHPIYPRLGATQDVQQLFRLVHRVENNLMMILVPGFFIFAFTVPYFIRLWLNNVEGTPLIIATAITAVASLLCLRIPTLPMRYYLKAKDLPHVIIFVNAAAALLNILFFLLLFRWLGYYGILIGFVAGELATFIVTLYWQRRCLNSLIFDTPMQLMKLLAICSLLAMAGFTLTHNIVSNWIGLILVPTVLGILLIGLWRCFGIYDLNTVREFWQFCRARKLPANG